MSQVETVALWIGLLVGVASIVLAVVALWFTFEVDKRSREVSDQMIRSLQKIESTVERSSGDTVDLIKVAWERLLGTVPDNGNGNEGARAAEEDVKQIVAGVTAELKADLSQQHAEGQPSEADILARVDRLAERLERSLRGGTSRDSSSDRLIATTRMIDALTPRARELVRQLYAGGHLTHVQYQALSNPESGLASEIRELRFQGVIGPLSAKNETGDDAPVYWFAPGRSRYLHTALELSGAESDGFAPDVKAALARVDYPSDDLVQRRRKVLT